MPEITQADRDRFQEWHDFDATLAPIDASDKQRLLEAFAAHREAAVAEGAKVERERIVDRLAGMREIAVAHCSYEAAVAFRDALAAIKELKPTTPPEPRALTAEIVKEMLPANRKSPIGCDDYAYYESPIGSLHWDIRANGRLALSINFKDTPLEAIGTDRKLAEIVAAFGISAGVKHG